VEIRGRCAYCCATVRDSMISGWFSSFFFSVGYPGEGEGEALGLQRNSVVWGGNKWR